MENKKEYGLIVFPELDTKRKYFWLNLLLFTLASLIRRLVPALIIKNIKVTENDLKEYNYNKNHSFFDLFSNFLADILAGFIILINKCIEKIKSNKVTTANGEKDVEKMKKKSFLYLSIIAIIDIIAQLCLLIFTFIIDKKEILEEESIKSEDLYFTVLIDIISRYITNTFKSQLMSTPGANFVTKTVIMEDENQSIKFEIWDTAGQERYRALAKVFYKNAAVCVLVYDITRKASFEELKNYWVKEIKENAPQDISK